MRCTVNYSDRLKKLKMFSLERCKERYAIIYMYKILIKYAPSVGLEHYPHRSSHIFRTKIIPDNRPIPSWIKKACNSSFFVKGPLLYNCLPPSLRYKEIIDSPNKAHIERCKHRLDQFLAKIPDTPGTQSNSLLESIPIFRREQPEG